MEIKLNHISHSFHHNKVFPEITHSFKPQSKTVIKGGNGSGKSTLLKIISTFYTPTLGEISFTKNGQLLPVELAKNEISICSPALNLEGSFTLEECFDFHFGLRKMEHVRTKQSFFESCFLEKETNKKISSLSSGMLQRFKLALALFSKSSVILLDEPCMNLDSKGVEMYKYLVQKIAKDKTQIIASNSVLYEYEHCKEEIVLL